MKFLAEGGQGAAALVRGPSRNLLVAKQFPPKASTAKIAKEIEFGRLASAKGFGPRIHYENLGKRMFIMDAMDDTLCDVWKRQGHRLTGAQMAELADLIARSFAAGMVHNDPKCQNVMFKDGRMYLIDFGFTKPLRNAKYFSKMSPADFVGHNMDRIATDAGIVFGRRMDDIDDFLARRGYLTQKAKMAAKRAAAAAAFRARRK